MSGKSLLRKINKPVSTRWSRLSYRRKCRLYAVGAAKTGTHSINTMFDDTVRSSHEPESEETIAKILDLANGKIQPREMTRYLLKRDARLCLDVDSSQLNVFLLDSLLELFPKAHFLLTIRDCYSWLDSFINQSLRHDAPDKWARLRDFRFRAAAYSHPPEEHPLKARGLYTLDGYLSYWTFHNTTVLSSVPDDRLMVVRTDEITQRASDIARFAGLPAASVRQEHTNSFRAPKKYNVLNEIREQYLEDKVEEHCGVLMQELFPEVKTLHDAKL